MLPSPPADGNTSVAGNQDIPAGGAANSITIQLSTVSGMTTSGASSRILIHTGLNCTGTYATFRITTSNAPLNSVTVDRAQSSNDADLKNVATSKLFHLLEPQVWCNRTLCADAARSASPP